MDELNYDFIRRVENYNVLQSLNLKPSDFQTTQFKKEIRHLLELHLFSNQPLPTVSVVDVDVINIAISQVRISNPPAFDQLFTYTLDGIGRGEVLLFLILENSYLSGRNTSGVDMWVDDQTYEIKAAKISRDGQNATDFKLGGTTPTSDVVYELKRMMFDFNIRHPNNSIPKSIITKLKRHPDYHPTQTRFREAALNYFNKSTTIIINNNIGPKKGCVETIKPIGFNDIFIERVTENVVKPMIKIR